LSITLHIFGLIGETMGTPISVFKKYIYQVIDSNHPRPSRIDEFYTLIEENVSFDEHDLTPPTLRGNMFRGTSIGEEIRVMLYNLRKMLSDW